MQEQCKFLHLSNSEYCNWRSIYSKPSNVSERLWLNAWINGGCRPYQIPGVRFHGTYFSGVVWSDVEFRALFIWCPTECLGVESRDSFPRHQAKSEKGTVVRPPFDAYSNVLSPGVNCRIVIFSWKNFYSERFCLLNITMFVLFFIDFFNLWTKT